MGLGSDLGGWVPSELCPSDEASRWCNQEQEVFKKSRLEPRVESERRATPHGMPQRSGAWVRKMRRARRAAHDHPAELAYLWSLCRPRDTQPDAPTRANQRQSGTLQDARPEEKQGVRANATSSLRKVKNRPPGAGFLQSSGARSQNTREHSARGPQCTRPQPYDAQAVTKRHRGNPRFQAIKGRTAVVLMGAGAPIVKALRCLGFVVHSCSLVTLRTPRARDRISRLCRECSFVVYATLPLTYIDRALAVRDFHWKPWPDTSSKTKGRCRTEDRIFVWMAALWRYLSSRRVPQIFAGSAKCSLWTINSLQRAFENTNTTFAWHDSCQHGTRFKNAFKVARANILDAPDNSLCIASHIPCR